MDPDFDFKKDRFSKNHSNSPYENDVYAHQIFDNPPYDGILISLGIFGKKISINNDKDELYIRNKKNIKEFLKIPEKSKLEVMGDCGAFSYIKEKKPPEPFYSIENVSNLYHKLGFDYGVSIDHLVVDSIFVKDKHGKRKKKLLSKSEKNRRIKLTVDNAKKFIKHHDKNDYQFKPIGVAQGYDIDSYRKSVKSIIDLGYEYIALGSLVQYRSEFIIKILNNIQDLVDDVEMHLFGVLRENFLLEFENLGVTSFDSTSYLRKSWLRSGQNYLSLDNKWYSAIRVPQANNSRITKNIEIENFDIKKLEKLEKNALESLFKYDEGKLSLEETLHNVMEYDKLFLRSSENEKFEHKYKRTLMDKPWEKCNCPFCKSLGINVLIFRGTNRNKRRGFHNLWAFRKNYEDKNNLCIVTCGSKKIWDKYPSKGPTRAKDVYIGPLSQKCQLYAEKNFPGSWCILSAKHGFLFPEDIIEKNYNSSFNNNDCIGLDYLIRDAEEMGLNDYNNITVLGGKNYETVVKNVFKGKLVENPLSGCKGIGMMLKRLNEFNG